MSVAAAKPKPKPRITKPPVNKPADFRVRRMVVTPEMAVAWLEKNVNNRKLREPMEDRTVDSYARDMKAGRWHLTGDPVKFDTNGDLLDGQHRLWACIVADVPFETTVAYGVEPSARIVVDTGKKRTLGHYLQMTGEPSAMALAATVTLCLRVERGNIAGDGTLKGARLVVNHEDAVEFLADNPDLRQSVELSGRVYRELKFGKTQCAAAHYLNARVDAEQADIFWEQARTGAELPADSVVLSLRRWAMNQRASRHTVPGDLIFVHFIKAMAMWRAGRKSRILSVKPGEQVELWK